jgi:hypothetical protein
MTYAESYAVPLESELGAPFPRQNDFREVFYLRWGRLRFALSWGAEMNLKVVLKVWRTGGVCEHFLVDTDPYELDWNRHKRVTRDFFVHPFPAGLGRTTAVCFSYIVHLHGRSIPSQHDYVLADGWQFDDGRPQHHTIALERVSPNGYRTMEVDAALLQRDVDWHSHHFESLNLVPKFTKGTPTHPYHPKRYIHDTIDKVIRICHGHPARPQTIKVCVDCIDDTDFVNHLLLARDCGVAVQCIVDWRKMTLTNSPNYHRLKNSRIELLGVFCTPKDPAIEVTPDMHTKFVIFGDEDCIVGSFNIAFDRWWANWESGMTFRSYGVCRLFDNIFQSIRGGVIQRYGIDPYSPFNLLYTFGQHALLNGSVYRPHHAILAEINRARQSIRLCLFLIGELRGEHHDSVIDALIQAQRRGVDVRIILNGHIAHQGDPGREYTLTEEVARPLIPAVARLKRAGLPVGLAYGRVDQRVPYCPLHSKYGVIDHRIVLDGSFNWYNASVFSHDLLIIAADERVAGPYLYEFDQIQRLLRFIN